jgi:hypothetical protein
MRTAELDPKLPIASGRVGDDARNAPHEKYPFCCETPREVTDAGKKFYRGCSHFGRNE